MNPAEGSSNQTKVKDATAALDRSLIQAIVDQSLATVSESLVKTVDARLEKFKKRLAPNSSESLRSSKRLKIEAKQIKKPGNQQQFDHSIKVLEKLESAIEALDQNRLDKAKDALQEGMDLVLHCIKLVRIADKSEFGWETVNQYEADKLASDSEDDKRIYRSERRLEKEADASLSASYRIPLTVADSSTTYPIPTFTVNRVPVRSALGPCYTCSKFGHLQAKCNQKATFEVIKPQS